MSDKIDKRIVEMSFENHKFEKGISQSKKSFKDFTDVLNNSKIKNDFADLESPVNSFTKSFSMLEQIGVGALRRIGENAVDAGARLIKSLSIDQISDGFNEYELKINTIQAIMNSTGESADTVRDKLKILDDYADKTIYSTKDMFDNLATFTNAGISLDKASTAMIGIANATAYAGQNTTAATYAYRNFSDAISNGHMSLMDWRSISRVAKIGTQEFRTEILKTAVELGTLTQAQIDSGKVTTQFEDTLKDQWFTADVVTAVLNKYGDVTTEIGAKAQKAAQEIRTFSGMMESIKASIGTQFADISEIIFGDLEEAKRNFGYLNDILSAIFVDGLKESKAMLASVKELGGISNIFQGIKNVAVGLLSVLKPISEAFDQFFPPRTKEQWLGITETFKNFTASLIITEETADKVRRTFAGFFAVVDIGWQVLKFLGNAAFELVKIFIPLGSGVVGVTASLGDFLVYLNNLIKSTQFFEYGLLAIKIGVVLLRQGLSTVISVISDFVSGLWAAESPLKYLQNVGGQVFAGLIKGIKMAVDLISGRFMKTFQGVKTLFSGMINETNSGIWVSVLTILRDVVEFIVEHASEGFQKFGEVIKNLDFNKIATFVTGGVLLIFVKQLTDLTGAMTGLTNTMTTTVASFNKKLFAAKPIGMLRDLAYALGILTASIWILSRIPIDDLNKSLIGLAKAVAIFVGAYALIQTINITASKLMKDTDMVSSAFGLAGLASALLIMTIAIKTISGIDETQVWNSTLVLGAMLGFVAAYQLVVAVIGKIPNQQKLPSNLLAMSTSLLMLVGVLALLNTFSPEAMKNGLSKMVSILAVIAAVQGAFAIAARIGYGDRLSVSLLGLAAGIVALVGVMKLLAFIDPSVITKSLGNLARIVLIITGIEVLMGLASRIGGEKLKSNMLTTAGGILAMVGLIALLGTMEQSTIDRGIVNLTKMAGLVVAIELLTATAARIAGGAKVQKILGSVTLTMLSFTGVIAVIGVMRQETIDKGIMTLTKMVGLIAAIELVTALASRISEVKNAAGDPVKGNSMFSSLIGVVLSIIVLTGALALLTMIDQESLRGAAVSLAIASVAILAIGFALEKMATAVDLISKGSKGFIEKTKNIGITLVAVGALLVATAAFFGTLDLVLPAIKNVSWEELGMFVVGLGAITTVLAVLNHMGDSKYKEGDFANLVPLFGALAGVLLGTMGFFVALKVVLPLFDSISWESIGTFTLGLGVTTALITGLALLSGPLKALGSAGLVALKGVGIGLIAFAGIILTVVGIAQLLSLIALDGEMLSRGLDLLVLVGAGIGRFVGAFAGGIVGGVLEGIGASLSGFARALGDFSPESLQGVKYLAEALLLITGASVLDGITRFITGSSSMDVFGEQISGLIKALKNIDSGDAQKASDILAVLTPMSKNLVTFSEAAKGIPASGGLLQAIMGNTTLDEMGKQISGMVTAFLGTPESPLSPTLINEANANLGAMLPLVRNLKPFIELTNELPNSGGLFQALVGNTTLDEMGAQVSGMAKAFLGTPDNELSVDSINEANANLVAMLSLIENLNPFITLTNELPKSGGLKQIGTGDQTLSAFATQLSLMVRNFKKIKEKEVETVGKNLTSMNTSVLPALISFSNLAVSLFNTPTGTALSDFGKEFKLFVNALSGANYNIVTPAMKALRDVKTSFETIGKTVIENAKTSFDNNKEPFQKSIATILDAPIKKLEKEKKTLVRTVTSIFKAVTDEGDLYVKEFEKLGENIVKGLKKGVNSQQPSAVNTIKKVMTDVATAARDAVKVESPSKVFETIGGWCTKGLANGLTKETKVAVRAGNNMAKSVEDGVRDSLGVHSMSKLFSGIGGFVPKSLGSGIQNGKSALLDTAKNLGISTGDFTIKGVVEGVSGGEGAITSGINSLLDILTGPAGGGTVTPAAQNTGKNIGNSVTSSFQKALSNSSSGLGGSKTKEIIKEELDELQKLKKEIQYESAYDRITIPETLRRYEEILPIFPEGSEQREEIKQEIYSLQKTIYAAQNARIEGMTKAEQEARQERDDIYKKEADLRSKYAQDVFKEHLKNNKKIEEQEEKHQAEVQKLHEETEQKKKSLLDQHLLDQKAIYDKLKNDIEEQDRIYTDALKSRSKEIYNYYGLFDSVEKEAKVSGTQLLQNLRDQKESYEDWEKSLSDLSARGVSGGFIEEIQAMGVANKSQIKALLSLSDGQLMEYMDLYRSKYSFANDKAEDELKSLRQTTRQSVTDLQREADNNVDILERTYYEARRKINADRNKDLGDLRETNRKAMEDINADYSTSLETLKTNWHEAVESIESDLTAIPTNLAETLTELKTTFEGTLKLIQGFSSEDLRLLISENELKLGELNTSTETILEDLKKVYIFSGEQNANVFPEKLSDITPKTNSVLDILKGAIRTVFDKVVQTSQTDGFNLAKGFAIGITKGIPFALTAIRMLTNTTVKTTEKILDERSPSKVFEGIGRFVSLGFANGIRDYAKHAENAGIEMAEGPLSAITHTLSELGDSDEFSFTITPVLDLSQVYSNNALQLFGKSVELGEMSQKLTLDEIQNGNQTQVERFAKITNQANSKMLESLESLENRFSDLVSKVGDLQVVMDTGVVVGAIAPRMDGELGRLTNMTRRGVR